LFFFIPAFALAFLSGAVSGSRSEQREAGEEKIDGEERLA
jgi:hypothetical protein